MKYVKLGKTGLDVSVICLGCMSYGTPDRGGHEWTLGDDDSRPFLRRAVEAGINFFDTANVYSDGTSEEIVGKALADFARRDEVVLATKVHGTMRKGPNGGGLSRKVIMHEIDASLRRLGTDYVDLYQIHRWDRHTPIEETLEALHDVVKAGKALYIGASSMFAWQFMKMLAVADAHGWTRFVSMQNHCNLVYREEEREMLPLCKAEGIGVIPWSPLARGFLAGNRKRGTRDATLREQHDGYGHGLYYADADYAVADRVAEVARAKGVLPIEVALAWVANRPGVTAPIISATRIEQLDQLVAGLAVTLSDDERRAVEELYVPHQVLGNEP